MNDELLCNLILRFVFFDAITKLHMDFKALADAASPICHPALPPVSTNSDVVSEIKELVAMMPSGSEYMS